MGAQLTLGLEVRRLASFLALMLNIRNACFEEVSLSGKWVSGYFSAPSFFSTGNEMVTRWLISNHQDRVRPLERQIISLMYLLSDPVRVLSSLLNDLLIIIF